MAVKWQIFFSAPVFMRAVQAQAMQQAARFRAACHGVMESLFFSYYSAQVPLRKMAALLPSGRKPVMLRSSAPTMKST